MRAVDGLLSWILHFIFALVSLKTETFELLYWEDQLTLEMMFPKLGSKLLTGVVGGTGAGLFLVNR